MKNRPILGIAIFILFSTFISQKKITFNKFKIKEIKIVNNSILEERELDKNFSFLYNKNLIFLGPYDLKKVLDSKNFIKKLEIKKVFPNKLVIKVFEKEPIAILIDGKRKFYLGKKIDLIEYREISKTKNLPIVYGNQKKFEILFFNLIKINFPMEEVQSYYLFKSDRWDITMKNNKIIRLPDTNYNLSLENFLKIKNKKRFNSYKIFDYRLKNQLILK